MTPRERTLAVLAKQRPDRLPRELKLTPPLLESFRQRIGRGRSGRLFCLGGTRRILRPARQNGRLQSATIPTACRSS